MKIITNIQELLKKLKKGKSSKLITADIPLQIRIGVTGHRNTEDTQQLRKSIKDVLTNGIPKIINTQKRKIITPISYKVVTPLADGADRIIAEEVMQILNAKMEVVLPMLQEEYEQTFYDDNSIKEFQSLLIKAASINITISHPLQEQFPGSDINDCKHIAYQKNAKYIVDNCDILIAIWNGKKTDKESGTYATLAYAWKKKKTVIVILANTPHKSSINRGDDFIRVCTNWIELFNSFPLRDSELQLSQEEDGGRLFNNNDGKLNSSNLDIAKEKIFPFYKRASKIAKKYQPIHQKTGLAVFILSPLAVAAVALGILLHHASTIFFIAEFIILLIVVIIIVFSQNLNVHGKWIQSRFLAEQLRTTIIFIICGFKPTPIKVSSHLRLAHRPDDWMVKIQNEILKRLPEIPTYDGEQYKDLLEYIKTNWLLHQLKYHQGKSATAGKMHRYLEWFGLLVFIIALCVAEAHLIIDFMGYESELIWMSNYVIFIAITFPALGASLAAIRTHREYSRIEKRSENMITVLEELLEDGENVKSMDDFKILLTKIEEAILPETIDWLMLMKFVKLEAV